jgi:hypothetical protein
VSARPPPPRLPPLPWGRLLVFGLATWAGAIIGVLLVLGLAL